MANTYFGEWFFGEWVPYGKLTVSLNLAFGAPTFKVDTNWDFLYPESTFFLSSEGLDVTADIAVAHPVSKIQTHTAN